MEVVAEREQTYIAPANHGGMGVAVRASGRPVRAHMRDVIGDIGGQEQGDARRYQPGEDKRPAVARQRESGDGREQEKQRAPGDDVLPGGYTQGLRVKLAVVIEVGGRPAQGQLPARSDAGPAIGVFVGFVGESMMAQMNLPKGLKADEQYGRAQLADEHAEPAVATQRQMGGVVHTRERGVRSQRRAQRRHRSGRPAQNRRAQGPSPQESQRSDQSDCPPRHLGFTQ